MGKIGQYLVIKKLQGTNHVNDSQEVFKVKEIENNVCTQVTNCFSAHERVILVFISQGAKQQWK